MRHNAAGKGGSGLRRGLSEDCRLVNVIWMKFLVVPQKAFVRLGSAAMAFLMNQSCWAEIVAQSNNRFSYRRFNHDV